MATIPHITRYESACYLLETGGPDEACTLYKRALIALPKSLLLHFIYADLLESLKRIKVQITLAK
jgi:hypothetical protein